MKTNIICSSSLFIFKIAFSILTSFYVHIKLKISLSVSTNNAVGILLKIISNLCLNFRRIDIFTINMVHSSIYLDGKDFFQ